MSFEGQRGRNPASGETHSHGVGNGRLRLNQQSQDLLDLSGEWRRLTCTSPEAVTCDGPCGRNFRQI